MSPRVRVGLDEPFEVTRGCSVDALERLLHDARDLQEADAAVEEGGDGHLVRCVEGAGVRAAPLPRLAREPEEREARHVGSFELERHTG